jgi:hypothetical protein
MFKANVKGLYLQEYDIIVLIIKQLQDIRDNEKFGIHYEVGE